MGTLLYVIDPLRLMRRVDQTDCVATRLEVHLVSEVDVLLRMVIELKQLMRACGVS